MEKCHGKPGLCLTRRIAVTIGIWMLWIIIVPLVVVVVVEASSDSCPDPSDMDIPCPLNELAGVTCTYVKGIPAHAQLPELPIGSTNFTGCVKQLTVQPYLRNYYRTSSYAMYLNITWKIDASGCRNLSGFILNATFVYDGIQRYIYRTYSLSVDNWNDLNIFETAFRHECIVPSMSDLYRIEVRSLPLSTNDRKNVAVVYYKHSAVPAGYPTDPDSSYSWRASMWMTRISSEDSLRSSVNVCFFFAPSSFGFRHYRMSLVQAKASVLLLASQTVFIHDNGTEKRHECVTLENVSPGIYKVYLLPLPEFGACTCRAGPNDCRDSCSATVFGPIDMTESVYKPPPPPSTTTLPPTSEHPTMPIVQDTATDPNRSKTAALPPTSEHPQIPIVRDAATADSNHNKTDAIVVLQSVGLFSAEKNGIVVVATVAVVVLITSAVVVVVIILLVICRRREKVSLGNSAAVLPFLKLEKQTST